MPSSDIYYVYQYVRNDGTPYYIGKGKGNRAYSKNHKVAVPKDRSNIVFVVTNVSEEVAHMMEIELIAAYGRKDQGTGILRNLTDGGDGCSGRILSERSKALISQARKNWYTDGGQHPRGMLGKSFTKSPCDVLKTSGHRNGMWGATRKDLAASNADPVLRVRRGQSASRTKILKLCKMYGFDTIEAAANYFTNVVTNIGVAHPYKFIDVVESKFLQDHPTVLLPHNKTPTLLDLLKIPRPKRKSRETDR